MSTPLLLRTEYMSIKSMVRAPRNPKGHDGDRIERAMDRFGFMDPGVLDERTGRLVAGHGRLDGLIAMMEAGQSPPEGVELRGEDWYWPVTRGWASRSDVDAEAALVALNRLSEIGGWDDPGGLVAILEAVAKADAELVDIIGYTTDDLADLSAELERLGGEDWGDGTGSPRAEPVNLQERFGVPPFTVLDTRQGYWQARKKSWLALGITSEVGRGTEDGRGIVFNSAERRDPDFYDKKTAKEAELGRELGTAEYVRRYYDAPDSAITSGTSIFDPVLCELVYRWYCPPGGVVIDPFAGGSVRGVVAAALGRRYFGGELRAEQVEANHAQWATIGAGGHLAGDAPPPVWVGGDSRDLRGNFDPAPPRADLLFTCPPYADLEVYSDDPADLSTMAYPAFLKGFRACLAAAVAMLADDSFAVLTVGEVRSRRGHGAYYGFVPDTIGVMGKLGLDFYAEHILVNMVGSAAMAANRQFTASRKAVHTHQTVLIFVKGDGRAAAARNQLDEQIDLPDPAGDDDEGALDIE